MENKFVLGEVIVTPRARQVLGRAGLTADEILARHGAGDWGDVSDEQWGLNELALHERFNLISAYATPEGERVTVFTKNDRSFTLVHLAPVLRQSVAFEASEEAAPLVAEGR